MEPITASGEARGEQRPPNIPTSIETSAAASVLVNPVGGRAEPSGDALVSETQDPFVPMG